MLHSLSFNYGETKMTIEKTNNSEKSSSHVNWTALIIAGWMVLVTASMYERARPPSDWLQINNVFVEDTTLGNDPVMDYSRIIKMPFKGNWVAEIQFQHQDGTWEAECTATGTANYSIDKLPPDPLTLTWWTYPKDCTPKKAGTYRISTTWSIELPSGLTKHIFALSNLFKVS